MRMLDGKVGNGRKVERVILDNEGKWGKGVRVV